MIGLRRSTVTLAVIALLACDGPGGFDGGSDDTSAGSDVAVMDTGAGGDANVVDTGMPPPSGWSPQPWEECEGGGRTLSAGPSDYRDVLDTLAPGDTLRLAGGDYARGLPVRVSGTPGSCIVIEAADDDDRPRFEGSDSFNIVALHGASWVKVRNFDIDGMGLAGFGVAAQGSEPTHHVVVEGMDMVGLGGDQQIVGVSTKSPAWDWVIRRNRIVGAGTGMYLGNSDGGLPFIRGVVELNTILDTIGYCAQIKHQSPRAGWAGMPEDGAQTLVRYNVFSKQTGSSSGSSARPNLLLGHFPTSGVGANDRYLVYGNFFYDNATEMLMQAEGNVAIYANVLVNPNGGAIAIIPHNDVPRVIDVFMNTIVAEGRGLDISGGDPSFSQRARYNAIYGPSPLLAEDELGNIIGTSADAAAALEMPVGAVGGDLDLHPRDGVLESAIDSAELPDLRDRDLDFDGLTRDLASAARIGAYGGGTTASSVPLARAARAY